MRTALQRALYRYGWDTRCRNLVAARALRSVLAAVPPQDCPVLLDVGCGRFGLAAFLRGVSIVGTDVELPVNSANGFIFQPGDVTALPFRDHSFPVVSCVDVLEHLSLPDRERAVQELVRVAERAVLIACPHGQTAQDCDEIFRRACAARGRPLPAWVAEHQQHPYPVSDVLAEQVQRAAEASGRMAKISLSYCEPARVCRLVRAAAARSSLLYAAVNLFFGALFAVMPTPDAQGSYRMVLMTELS